MRADNFPSFAINSKWWKYSSICWGTKIIGKSSTRKAMWWIFMKIPSGIEHVCHRSEYNIYHVIRQVRSKFLSNGIQQATDVFHTLVSSISEQLGKNMHDVVGVDGTELIELPNESDDSQGAFSGYQEGAQFILVHLDKKKCSKTTSVKCDQNSHFLDNFSIITHFPKLTNLEASTLLMSHMQLVPARLLQYFSSQCLSKICWKVSNVLAVSPIGTSICEWQSRVVTWWVEGSENVKKS